MKPRASPWLFMVAWILAGCERGAHDATVATVGGAAIHQSEVSVELRAILWRRGETWDDLGEDTRAKRREEALDRCVNRLLLSRFAATRSEAPASEAAATEDAFQQFLKQFEPPEGWKPRLEGQGLGEMQMRTRIADEVAQQRAIEEWLNGQRQGSNAPNEPAARAWYEQHLAEMQIPAQAKVSHIFLTTHDMEKPDRTAEIAEISRKLSSGEATFAALASRYSEDERSKKVGGELGWLSRDRVPEEFATQIFSLPLAKPSAPFRTHLGWHIVLVRERKESRHPTFAEVKDEIMARLDQPWREEKVAELLKALREGADISIDHTALQLVLPAALGG